MNWTIREFRRRAKQPPCVQTTLLELVRALSETTQDENEVVATVLHMVREKRVRLNGAFQDRDVFSRR